MKIEDVFESMDDEYRHLDAAFAYARSKLTGNDATVFRMMAKDATDMGRQMGHPASLPGIFKRLVSSGVRITDEDGSRGGRVDSGRTPIPNYSKETDWITAFNVAPDQAVLRFAEVMYSTLREMQ